MTCGACHPEAYQSDNGGRIFGYAVAAHPGRTARLIRQLHFMGAEYVYVDQPVAQVCNRPGYRSLRKVSRSGDTIILGDAKCLGSKSKQAERNISLLDAEDIEVHILNTDQ